MSTEADLNAVSCFISHVAQQAGDLLMTYFRGEFGIEAKNDVTSDIDIVTDADRASEDLILEALGKEFPDHDIVSEETPLEIHGSKWRWLVDPLDGTVNFAHGFPAFCVSIALMEAGELVAGIVYDPLRKERFWATRGGGAFVNEHTIRVSSATALNRSLVATGFPYDRSTSPDNNVAEFSRVITHVQGMRRAGSAAMDLAYVAGGRLDGFWELKLKPWDQAAGMLLVSEAGGRVTDRYGMPCPVDTLSVVATNGRIHELLLGLISPND